jgi:hypothetical protein
MSSNWPLRAERSLIGLTIPVLTFLIELKLPLVNPINLFGYSMGRGVYKELLIIVAGIACSLLILSTHESLITVSHCWIMLNISLTNTSLDGFKRIILIKHQVIEGCYVLFVLFKPILKVDLTEPA